MSINLVSQSGCRDRVPASLHVAIIMDGNGRWATERGLPRVVGHRAGAVAVRRVTEEARAGGLIRALTLFAFSADNWGRPRSEVDALMELFEEHLRDETGRCARNGIRLRVIGRRDRLRPSLRETILQAERATAAGNDMLLRLGVDYSGRDAILAAAGKGATSREEFARILGEVTAAGEPALDVDLLIRTGGERRLSDFLLWECAYAELHFVERWWPDFSAADLREAIDWYSHRERRFGLLTPAV